MQRSLRFYTCFPHAIWTARDSPFALLVVFVHFGELRTPLLLMLVVLVQFGELRTPRLRGLEQLARQARREPIMVDGKELGGEVSLASQSIVKRCSTGRKEAYHGRRR